MNRQLLDQLPILAILIVFVGLMLVAYEIGFRIGRWWQDKTPDESAGPGGVLVGSLLGLLAFVLAITMGMASDRFDTRRGLVLEEANAIWTTYQRAGYQPEPQRRQVRELLDELASVRIATSDPAQLVANIARSEEINVELWAIAEELVATTENSDLLALFVESVNEIVELHETRVISAVYARLPETVMLLLLAGSTLTLGMVGYSSGLTGRRSVVSAVVLVIALSAVTVLVLDLDRPRDGLLQVSQQPLLDVQRRVDFAL